MSRRPRRCSMAPMRAARVDVRAVRSSPVANRIAPSRVLSATLPVKPSVTITSTAPAIRSPPSMFPAKCSGSDPGSGSDASSSCARRVSTLPLPASAPMVSRPTFGIAMPSAICAYATPSWPNCTSISGLGSAVAPASMRTVGLGASAGPRRCRAGERPAAAAAAAGRSRRSRRLSRLTRPRWPARAGRAGRPPRCSSGDGGTRRARPRPSPPRPRRAPRATPAGPEPGDHRPEPGRRPGEERGHAVLALGGERARDDLVRRVVAAHRVHRDHGHG